MAEVLPRHLVGPVLMASQMCSMMGSLAIAILSFDEIFATPELWPTIVGEFMTEIISTSLLVWDRSCEARESRPPGQNQELKEMSLVSKVCKLCSEQ